MHAPYSRFTTSESLHAALAGEAEVEGVSLNQLVMAKLALNLQVP